MSSDSHNRTCDLTPPLPCRNERVRCNLSNICGTRFSRGGILSGLCFRRYIHIFLWRKREQNAIHSAVLRMIWLRVRRTMQVWEDALSRIMTIELAPLTCVDTSCRHRGLALADKCTENGWTHRTTGDGGGCRCHHHRERSWERAIKRGKVRRNRPKLSGHVPCLLSELSQSRAETSALSALFLQEMLAFTFAESGHERADTLPGWQNEQTTWVTLFTNNGQGSIVNLTCMQDS